VHKTKLATNDPYKQKRKWRKDLQQAVNETICEICPNWKTEQADLKLCNKIQKETERKRSPRQDWLQEKAYAWLKSSHKCNMLRDYPRNEIKIAHEIFLCGAGDIRSFVKYLKNRKQSPYLKQLINAHESKIATTTDETEIDDNCFDDSNLDEVLQVLSQPSAPRPDITDAFSTAFKRGLATVNSMLSHRPFAAFHASASQVIPSKRSRQWQLPPATAKLAKRDVGKPHFEWPKSLPKFLRMIFSNLVMSFSA